MIILLIFCYWFLSGLCLLHTMHFVFSHYNMKNNPMHFFHNDYVYVFCFHPIVVGVTYDMKGSAKCGVPH